MLKEIVDTSEMIFVFGSNEAGIHGGGAARYAKMERGAEWGFSYGRTGECFAIPTKGYTINNAGIPRVGSTLEIIQINRYVKGFLAYAEGHPEEHYQITCIGCGLAGLQHSAVAPLFISKDIYGDPYLLNNLYFDEKWKPYLYKFNANIWGEG